MKFLSSERLSQHRFKTPEGYLICTDAILARTGKQTYRKSEVFADTDDDSTIEIDRKSEEVFSPETLASFENKPVTVEHPDTDVNSDNYNELAVGFVRDVRKGNVNGQEVMLGNLVITDAKTIEEIEAGEHTDLSCGYDCEIVDEANPQQTKIRGNHVALCEQGRAGIARIVDSETVNDSDYSEARKAVEHWKKENRLAEDIIKLLNEKFKQLSAEERQAAYEEATGYKFELKYFDSMKDVSSFTYYKGFVFEGGDMSAPIFEGFDRDMVVQKIRGFSLWIVYKRNGSHSEMYNFLGHRHEGFTVIIEPGKITIDKLHKYASINPTLIKAAKELEPTNNVVLNDSINDATKNVSEIKEYFRVWGYPSRSELQEVVNFYKLSKDELKQVFGNHYDEADLNKLKYHDSIKDDMIYNFKPTDLKKVDDLLTLAKDDDEIRLLNSLKAAIKYELQSNKMSDSTDKPIKTFEIHQQVDDAEEIHLVKATDAVDAFIKFKGGKKNDK